MPSTDHTRAVEESRRQSLRVIEHCFELVTWTGWTSDEMNAGHDAIQRIADRINQQHDAALFTEISCTSSAAPELL